MPASRPKRRKLAAILLLLGGRAIEQMDLGNDGTVFETLLNQMAFLKPQMAVDENNWSPDELKAWLKTEELDESDPDFEAISAELEALIAAL